MKQLLVFFLFLHLIPVFSLELKLDSESDFRLSDCRHEKFDNLSRLYLSQTGNNHYEQIALKSYYHDDDGNFSLDRAYLECYRGDSTYVAGKQRIFWGIPLVFNFADIFTLPDLTDPKKERDGVKALKFRQSLGQTSRLELVTTDRDHCHNDQAGRYTFTRGRFEYMLNLLSHHLDLSPIMPDLHLSSRDLVLEFKGEVKVGIWGELALKHVDLNQPLNLAFAPHRQLISVLGMDYTFDVHGRSLYLMAEGYRNNDTGDKACYLNPRFQITQTVSASAHVYKDLLNRGSYRGGGIEYVLNDFYTLGLEYRCSRKLTSQVLLTTAMNDGDEIVFSVKASF
ncbi:MAG: hypothetical protein PHW04_12430 [Candidatus Wallbacteria bacterium]|nr:hypothetical protein [Candidatus Wallbacteria bacterium]